MEQDQNTNAPATAAASHRGGKGVPQSAAAGAMPPPPAAPPLLRVDLARLRRRIQASINTQMFANAAFLADKLATLSGGEPHDVHLLARCYFLCGQCRRAVHTLERHGLLRQPMTHARLPGATDPQPVIYTKQTAIFFFYALPQLCC